MNDSEDTASESEDDDRRLSKDDLDDWTTGLEDDLEDDSDEENEDQIPPCLQKEKPKHNWFIIPQLLKREVGNNRLFQQKYYSSLHAVERLELMYKMEEHQGCVNALNFNQKGDLLASGSDDLAVVVWNWAIGAKLKSFESGHSSNVFQTVWMPVEPEYLIATCARDGQVRLLDITRETSREIGAHFAPTHKLAVHPETPYNVISVGEDGRVLSIDIRDRSPTKLLIVIDGSRAVPLFTVHSNPLNSNEFCVGGRFQFVHVYDRRKPSKSLQTLCPEHLNEISCVHVTCAVYNYNGTEILMSYNDENIYLFDVANTDPGDFAHCYQGHWNSASVKGVNFFGPKSEFIVSGSDCGRIFFWEKNTEAIVQWMRGDECGVVNCLEPHPHIPILATSGLDSDVKIWIPSCEEPPTLKGLKECVRCNTHYSLIADQD